MGVVLSHEAEEYIEAIYKLQEANGVAKTRELAKELRVVPGSITNTIEHLEKHGWVEHNPYRGSKLTATGRKKALSIVRRHRLAERLITDILGGKWSEVHESACKLEHALTDDLTRLLEKRLGNPRFCPHGNPIPTERGDVENLECCKLSETESNEAYIVIKITDEKREKLFLLANKGIIPKTLIHVVKREPSGLILCVEGKESFLDHDMASDVWVRKATREKNAVET